MEMTVTDMLDELQQKALRDIKIRTKLLGTRTQHEPFMAFCEACRELGYEIYPMDLIAAGEEFHAQMKRSTNGGEKTLPCWQGKMIFMKCFLQLSNLGDS